MARSRPKPEANEAKMDMTPIIDVVFNLLIFFMLTMDFQEEEGMLMAHLPKDQGLSKSQVKQEELEEIRVRIIRKTEGEATRVMVGQKEVADPVETPTALISQLSNMMSINSKTPVIIDATKKAEFKYVIAVLNSCKTAGVQEIKFAGKPIE